MPCNNKAVLIVDDDKVTIQKLKDKISEELPKIKVLTAYNFKEAVRWILNKNEKIHAALLDLHLPDAPDGDIIKYAIHKGIPSIVLTGMINNAIKKAILENDIFDYIVKDGNKDLLFSLKSIKRVLKNYDTNILVVDDSKTQVKQLTNILETMNFNVTTASNGLEAYEIIMKQEIEYSLVVTDYNMPKMDGLELTLKIREHFGKDQLAILAISSNNDETIPSQFIKLGANDFISKPFKQIEIKTKINAILDTLDLIKQIKQMSNVDFLTGAYNRRYFFDVGEKIFSKAKRDNKNIAVAMLDIDKFKSINDTYGHDAGDIALKEMVKILNKSFRKSDLIARFGGEEFCVLLQDISKENTQKVFEGIRKKIEQHKFDVGEQKLNFTASIGISYGLGDTLFDMVKSADDALYFCKNNGRNQILLQ